MQARIHWTAPSGALGRLMDRARQRAAVLGRQGGWEARAAAAASGRGFGEALQSDTVSVIAELKRRSPSRGALDDSMDASQRAQLYQEGGADALSVLTEPAEFGGSVDDLQAVGRTCSLPLLRKDFHVHPVQLFEARAFGASAALLIVRALGPDDTRIMGDAAREAGVEALFEIRDDTELAWAMDAGAVLIGVNRRNLETLAMDAGVIEQLLPEIPPHLFAIAESGVSRREDVETVAALGADAVLVGSALSVSADPRKAVADLAGVPRSGLRG